MLADSVDPDQIALEQCDQGLHRLPVILLNAHNTLIQKHKVNVKAFPLKGNLKNNTIQMSFGRGKCMPFFECTKLTQDTCTLHQRKYRSVILITIKVLNIGTDRSDPDQTAPNYEQSDQGLHCFVIPSASFTVYAFTAIKKRVIYRLTIRQHTYC